MIAKITDQLGKLTLIANRDGQVVRLAAPGNGRPVAQARQAVLRGRRSASARGPHDRRPVRHPPDQCRADRLGQDLRQCRDDLQEPSRRNRQAQPRRGSHRASNMAGGEVASKPDPKTGTAKPITAVYEVIIPLDNTDMKLEPGLRGSAKIDGGTYTLALVALAGGTRCSTSRSEKTFARCEARGSGPVRGCPRPSARSTDGQSRRETLGSRRERIQELGAVGDAQPAARVPAGSG